jgi:hypothetical protein
MMSKPLNFETAQSRNDWIIEHAEYFTTCRMINRKYIRNEHKTLDEARRHAKTMLAENGTKPVLIYAVQGNSDTYIEMVKP